MAAPKTTTKVVLRDFVEQGLPKPEDFIVKEGEVPELKDGEVLLELLYVSVDPYMRGRLRNVKSYVPPFQPGQPLNSRAIATVVASKASSLPEGAVVHGHLSWQQLQVIPADQVSTLNQVDTQLLKQQQVSPSTFLGVLGSTGLTAYVGLKLIGQPKAGETVFVSGAAGAVGSVVGQLAKNVYGCRVVGSAGSDDKVELLVKELGYDAAFNYKTKPVAQGLAEYCPKGIDVYFDNVGGETLEAVLEVANKDARVVACGAISQYNAAGDERYGIKNLFLVVGKCIKIQGFIVSNHMDMSPAFAKEMAGWLHEGKVKSLEHLVTGGLPKAGQAFIDTMTGANIGKTVVQCAADPYRTSNGSA